LDVGAGSGIFAEAFSNRGLRVAGIDINPEMVNVASEFVPTAQFRIAPMESIPFEDKTFDIVFLGHVLHEADDLPRALEEAKRCAAMRVAVLEWPYKKEEMGPPIEHRLKTDTIIAFAKTAGFRHLETLPLCHMTLFLLTP